MTFSPYLWYQRTFKSLTKDHFVVLMLGMGLSGMWRTDLFVILCQLVIAVLQTNKQLKHLVQDITNQLLI